MKKLSGLLIGILILLLSNSLQAQCLPDSILSNIVDELIVKDGLEKENKYLKEQIKTLTKLDSTNIEKQKIFTQKILSYEQTIKDKDKLTAYDKAAIKDLQKESRKKSLRSFGKGFIVGGVFLTVFILVL